MIDDMDNDADVCFFLFVFFGGTNVSVNYRWYSVSSYLFAWLRQPLVSGSIPSVAVLVNVHCATILSLGARGVVRPLSRLAPD